MKLGNGIFEFYMNFELARNRIPESRHNFAEIRRNNLIYVDKTYYIQKIANSQAPVFISRPRRFGKSTIISTLEELFKHGVKPYDGHDSYFKGLDIEKTWNEEHEFDILPLLKQGDSYRPI